MNPATDQSADFDYLLGVGAATAPPTSASDLASVASVPAVQLATAVASVVPPVSANPNDVAPPPDVAALAVPPSATEHSAATTSTPTPNTPSTDSQPNSKKRPLEDKKARDRKRVLRNRELARVSNERRKGRIKAMENELNETRQTVSTLEESIRCLEAENQELRNLLQGKPEATAPGATAVAQPPVAPQ